MTTHDGPRQDKKFFRYLDRRSPTTFFHAAPPQFISSELPRLTVGSGAVLPHPGSAPRASLHRELLGWCGYYVLPLVSDGGDWLYSARARIYVIVLVGFGVFCVVLVVFSLFLPVPVSLLPARVSPGGLHTYGVRARRTSSVCEGG